MSKYSPSLGRRLLSLLAGALIPTAFLALIYPHPRMLWEFFISAAAYSFVIGGLAYAAIPYWWPRFLAFPAPWNWLFRFGILLAVAIVGTFFASLLLFGMGLTGKRPFWSVYLTDLRVATMITLVTGSLITGYESLRGRLEETTRQLQSKELERERALKLATEARLSSLASRLHPHFLFNTLNSVSALIREDPEGAERMIERLAALLRFSLDSEQAGLVPLARELKIVTDYLEIERARFGARLRYEVHLDPAAREALVPPLSVQTLAENSVKYAVGPNRAGAEIRIQGTCANGMLRVAVSDSGPGFDLAAAPAGHGLDTLRSRLAALFGATASLTVERSSVVLLIPQSGGGAS